jgi:hypothetical protein
MDGIIMPPTFVVLPKKYLKYFVLAYEVLPISLCYKINGTPYLSEHELATFEQMDEFDHRLVALELSSISYDTFVSLNCVMQILFKDDFDREDYLSKELGDFDLSLLELGLINQEVKLQGEVYNIEAPVSVSKTDFVSSMMEVDGLTAILNMAPMRDLLFCGSRSISSLNVRTLLLGIGHLDDTEKLAAELFSEECLLNGADTGWKPI